MKSLQTMEFMRYGRLALLALLCCLTMRESGVIVVGQVGDHGLPPNSEMPVPVEEGEADWLLVECDGDNAHCPAILVDLKLAGIRSCDDTGFHRCVDGRAMLNALHRLRI